MKTKCNYFFSLSKLHNNILETNRIKTKYTLISILLCTLILTPVTSDCGFIKILDRIKEYDGETADVINGTFNGYKGAQYSVFGFLRVLGDEVKTYSLFKFDNKVSGSGQVGQRQLQEGGSGYGELMSISFSKYNNSGEQVNLLVSK